MSNTKHTRDSVENSPYLLSQKDQINNIVAVQADDE